VGLEFLVIADIVGIVAVKRTFQNLVVLAVIQDHDRSCGSSRPDSAEPRPPQHLYRLFRLQERCFPIEDVHAARLFL